MSLGHGLIWKLSFEKDHFSYLYGTIHLSSDYFLRHREQIQQLMKSCSVFAAEIDLDKMSAPTPAASFHLPDGIKWSKALRPKIYEKLLMRCQQRFDFDLSAYQEMYPILVTYMLTFKLMNKPADGNLDQYLWDIAKQNGLECTGLESLENHFGVLAKIDMIDQIKMLKEMIFNERRSRRKLNTLISKYEKEQLQDIYKLSKIMLGKYKRLMLYDRNEEMLEAILNIGKNSNAFFACGAAHLPGRFGILRSLKKHGIKIQPVAF